MYKKNITREALKISVVGEGGERTLSRQRGILNSFRCFCIRESKERRYSRLPNYYYCSFCYYRSLRGLRIPSIGVLGYNVSNISIADDLFFPL